MLITAGIEVGGEERAGKGGEGSKEIILWDGSAGKITRCSYVMTYNTQDSSMEERTHP